MSDNKIKGDDLVSLVHSPKLKSLLLGGNLIDSFDDLLVLSQLEIQELELLGNPISDQIGYREKVFNIFKFLVILDEADENNEALEEEDQFDSSSDSEFLLGSGSNSDSDENEKEDCKEVEVIQCLRSGNREKSTRIEQTNEIKEKNETSKRGKQRINGAKCEKSLVQNEEKKNIVEIDEI